MCIYICSTSLPRPARLSLLPRTGKMPSTASKCPQQGIWARGQVKTHAFAPLGATALSRNQDACISAFKERPSARGPYQQAPATKAAPLGWPWVGSQITKNIGRGIANIRACRSQAIIHVAMSMFLLCKCGGMGMDRGAFRKAYDNTEDRK